jgi:LacI family transcriptional regulator
MAQEMGYRVPEDLSIIGFDSTDFCEETRPTLTSVAQPLPELGEQAAERIVEKITTGHCELLEAMLPCYLDVRGSTSPIGQPSQVGPPIPSFDERSFTPSSR